MMNSSLLSMVSAGIGRWCVRLAFAVVALMDGSAGRLAPHDLERLKQLIDEAEEKS